MLALARLVSLGMKSRAPRARASRVAWAPSWVRLDTISTARGISAMIRLRQPRPSSRGISTSRVTMSGLSCGIFSRASRPSRAEPTTSMSGAWSIRSRAFLMKGLSSTTSTRMGSMSQSWKTSLTKVMA